VQEGYTFGGWYSNEALTASYTFTTMPAFNLTLYGKWNIITYDITYQLDGGTNENNPSSYTIETETILLEEPIKEGYIFIGWYDNAEFSGDNLTSISTGTIGDITLNAKWSVNSYDIVFVENQGSSVNDIVDQNYNTEIAYPVTTRSGYTFSGWYLDNGTFLNRYTQTTIPSSNITLYAKWTPTEYSIDYMLNGGINSISNLSGYTIISSSIILSNPTKEGYTFSGWFESSDFSTSRVYFVSNTRLEDVTLYAKWSINQYTIIFNTNEGSLVESITQDYSSTVIALTNPTKSGYTFSGWYSDSSLKIPYTFTTMPASNITLYAKWTIIEYSIDYELDGGINSSSNPRSYYVTSNITLLDPTREGYTFIGWYNNADFSGDKLTSISTGAIGDITLYAKWSINTYTITYNIVSGDLNANDYILFLTGENITEITIGDYTSAALTTSGRVFIWGTNHYGQLGDNTTIRKNIPIEITNHFKLLPGEKIIQVTLRQYHSAALTSSGRLFMWGSNGNGKLGDGTEIDRLTPTEITSNFALSTDDKIIQVSLSNSHSSALTLYGRLFMWGSNFYGALGINSNHDTIQQVLLPREITSRFSLGTGDKIIQVSLGGYNFSSALTLNGRIFTWGYNRYGQLGNNTITTRLVPSQITSQFPLELGDKIIQISAGNYHSSALTSNGRIFTWGRNVSGQIGDNTTINKLIPTEITQLFALDIDDHIQSIIMSSTSAFYTRNGFIYKWGSNVLTPTKISGFPMIEENEIIVKIFINGSNYALITNLNNSFFLGPNYNGLLGNGTYQEVEISSASRWVVVESYSYNFIYNNEIMNPSINLEFMTLNGWYVDPNLLTLNSYTNMPSHDIVLYGVWLNTISFESNGGSSIEPISLLSGQNVTTPNNPVKDDYTFGGWYSDSSLTTPYTFTTMPDQNITLYAKWQNTITFNSNGGSYVDSITKDIDSEVVVPTNPNRTGYTFSGWYSDVELTTPFIFDTMPLNITLYARWQNTITFDSNGGSDIASLTQNAGSVVIEPNSPTRTGYTFSGWYSDANLTTPYTFSTMPEENITLHAKWNPNVYIVTYVLNDGSDDLVVADFAGSELFTPTREGHTFDGWYTNFELTTQYAELTFPISDLTLYAKWIQTE
jgi:uncharacterized repeat protein (TIGR02543 family)